MDEKDWLAERFEGYRPRLRAVAYRMLGSTSEAEDAVQEAWVRFSRSDTSDVENLGSWLTTVVSRVCLNMLRARRSRPETPTGGNLPEPARPLPASDPEAETVLADSVGLALLVVLDKLTPAERVAFVLHDMFAIPFEDIAPILGRSNDATRQLASRARRRVQGQGASSTAEGPRHAELVHAFLAAARAGNFSELLAVLDPDVVLRADDAAVALGAPTTARGAAEVGAFLRRARGARAALIDGVAGAVWMPVDRPHVLFRFATNGQSITAVELIADPDDIEGLDLVVIDGP
jgi:RNA polymerase sigma-70 factor (ECF subfamily)